VQERSRATVEAILTAAAQVFEEQGYAAGTTNRIAERAGVSIGTLYQYFPNKETLAVRLLERHVEQGERMIAGLIERARTQPLRLREGLRLFVDATLAHHDERPRLQHLLLEEAPRPPRLLDALRCAEDELIGAIAGLLQRFPEVPAGDLKRTAYFAVQTVELLTHQFAAHPPRGLSRPAFANEVVTLLEAYLTCRRGTR
jgi:AcrR family transcriptional regulator